MELYDRGRFSVSLGYDKEPFPVTLVAILNMRYNYIVNATNAAENKYKG